MAHFEMRPFIAPEAETVAHWADSRAVVRGFSDDEGEALTAIQVNAWALEANFAFTLRYNGDLVAYGEIAEDEVEGDIEVQHLLVAPDMRRRGIGTAMLSRLVAFAAASYPYPEVWMRVGRDDEPALFCARAVGFADDESLAGPRYRWLKKSLRP